MKPDIEEEATRGSFLGLAMDVAEGVIEADDGADDILKQIRARRKAYVEPDIEIGKWIIKAEDRDKPYVFIYTWMHDAGGEFDLLINGTQGMPDWWRDDVLKLNDPDLSEDEEYRIKDMLFGNFIGSKWYHRTHWSTFIGTYYDFEDHLTDDVMKYDGAARLCVGQFMRLLSERHKWVEHQRKE